MNVLISNDLVKMRKLMNLNRQVSIMLHKMECYTLQPVPT